LVILECGFSVNLVPFLDFSDYFVFCLVLYEGVNVLRCCAVEEKDTGPVDDEYAIAILFKAKMKTKPPIVAVLNFKVMQRNLPFRT
jgi:hypothetical protein